MRLALRLCLVTSLALCACPGNEVTVGAPDGTAVPPHDSGISCTPQCADRECGMDGCGGLCGTCSGSTGCNQATGQCICMPQCEGKACGSDGCGGLCGVCPGGLVCNSLSGVCATTCAPACGTRVCGTDGCGGSCGECVGGKACDASTGTCSCTPSCDGTHCGSNRCGGTCTCAPGNVCDAALKCAYCTPKCEGRSCGADGCGGSCGDCPAGDTCSAAGQCGTCVTACAGRTCGQVGGCSCGTCPALESCSTSGQCACTPQCQGKVCGPDGCGGVCGTCPSGSCDAQGQCPSCSGVCGTFECGVVSGCPCGVCLPSEICGETGQCECQAQCTGRECGADGCGGSCGTCPQNAVCDAAGLCACTASCGTKICGDDGCGGSCGTCPAGKACDGSGQCSCAPSCAGKTCGPDGCGGVCGTCGAQESCVSGACVCRPSCTGKTCGEDGCGGTCGTCGATQVCDPAASQCVECVQDVDCLDVQAPWCLKPGNTCVQCRTGADCASGTCDASHLCKVANDTCATPATLTFDAAGVAVVTADNTNGANDMASNCGGFYGNDLVWKIHLTTAKTFAAEVVPTGAGTLTPILSLRRTCDLDSSEISCNGPSNPGETATLGVAILGPGDYFLWVDGLVDYNTVDEGTKGPFTLTVTLTDPPGAPANDSCSGTVIDLPFTADAARAPGDTTWATDDARGSCGGLNGSDVVYSFTLTADRSVTVKVVADPSSPNYSPLFYLRTACADAGVDAERGCAASDWSSNGIAERTYPLLAAGTYYLWVDSPTASGGKFAVFVNLGAAGTGLNDYCSAATALDFSAGDTVAVSGTTAPAGGDTLSGCTDFDDNFQDLVWSFTTTAAKHLSASVTASGWQPSIFLRSSCGDDASELACNESSYSGTTASIALGWLPPGTYYLWVDGSSASVAPNAGNFNLSVTLSPADASAAGDTCLTPQPLAFVGTTATATGKTGFAADSGSGSCIPSSTSPDVVYTLTTAARGSLGLTLSTPTTTYQPAFYLRRACASTSTADELTCAAAAAGGLTATTMINDLPAGTYYLWVDGAGGTSGDYTLTATTGTVISPPANDLCSGATVLALGADVQGQTVAALDQYGQGPFSAICSGGAPLAFPGPDVVYTYKPSAAGSFKVVLTPEPGFDAVLWSTSPSCGGSGLNCTDLSDVGGGGAVESLNVAGVAGTPYYFVVDSASAASSGRFTIGVQ